MTSIISYTPPHASIHTSYNTPSTPLPTTHLRQPFNPSTNTQSSIITNGHNSDPYSSSIRVNTVSRRLAWSAQPVPSSATSSASPHTRARRSHSPVPIQARHSTDAYLASSYTSSSGPTSFSPARPLFTTATTTTGAYDEYGNTNDQYYPMTPTRITINRLSESPANRYPPTTPYNQHSASAMKTTDYNNINSSNSLVVDEHTPLPALEPLFSYSHFIQVYYVISHYHYYCYCLYLCIRNIHTNIAYTSYNIHHCYTTTQSYIYTYLIRIYTYIYRSCGTYQSSI